MVFAWNSGNILEAEVTRGITVVCDSLPVYLVYEV